MWLFPFHQGIEMLARFPEYGRTGRKPDTRELVFSGLPYLAVYRIHDGTVEIVRILQDSGLAGVAAG